MSSKARNADRILLVSDHREKQLSRKLGPAESWHSYETHVILLTKFVGHGE